MGLGTVLPTLLRPPRRAFVAEVLHQDCVDHFVDKLATPLRVTGDAQRVPVAPEPSIKGTRPNLIDASSRACNEASLVELSRMHVDSLAGRLWLSVNAHSSPPDLNPRTGTWS